MQLLAEAWARLRSFPETELSQVKPWQVIPRQSSENRYHAALVTCTLRYLQANGYHWENQWVTSSEELLDSKSDHTLRCYDWACWITVYCCWEGNPTPTVLWLLFMPQLVYRNCHFPRDHGKLLQRTFGAAKSITVRAGSGFAISLSQLGSGLQGQWWCKLIL